MTQDVDGGWAALAALPRFGKGGENRGYIGNILDWGCVGIMERKMESTIYSLGFPVFFQTVRGSGRRFWADVGRVFCCAFALYIQRVHLVTFIRAIGFRV